MHLSFDPKGEHQGRWLRGGRMIAEEEKSRKQKVEVVTEWLTSDGSALFLGCFFQAFFQVFWQTVAG